MAKAANAHRHLCKGERCGGVVGRKTGGNLFKVYQMTDTGVALQATVAGTKYWKDTKLNE